MKGEAESDLEVKWDSLDIVIVDVGCRWGFADRFIKQLDKFRLFGFEPDRDECERLAKVYTQKNVALFPFCLGEQEGKSRLHITEEPACSSMCEPDPYLIQNYPMLECTRMVDEIEVDVTTLDLWAKEFGIEYVDHIKIDTQGSELKILKGSEKILNTVRTIEIEVEFNPIYKDAALFSDVDRFLREHGFVLWKLTNLAHYGRRNESNIGLGEDRIHYDSQSQAITKYGGQLFWADAHYVRPEIVEPIFTTRQKMLRDLTLLECLNYLDLSQRVKEALGAKF